MSNDVALCQRVSDFLAWEAYCLDYQLWDDWLALYTPDCEYWVPAWDSDTELVTDPRQQVSLIYYDNREGLEDRVYRLRTGTASSAMPQARTSHQVSAVRILAAKNNTLEVAASWSCHWVWRKEFNAYAGRYEYTLLDSDNGLCIQRKKTIVINDLIPRVMDFYHI